MMKERKEFYGAEFLEKQIKYYNSLPEKQRRYFLAMEYQRLGRGSQRYLARVFGAARQVIVNGVKELQAIDFEPDHSRQRKSGGGRKKKKQPNLNWGN